MIKKTLKIILYDIGGLRSQGHYKILFQCFHSQIKWSLTLKKMCASLVYATFNQPTLIQASEHTVQLVAYDLGQPSLSSSLALKILVQE